LRITLAYPHDGHAPDKTIDVDDHTGRLMVRDGLARLPDDDGLDGMTVADLHAYADDHNIDLGEAKKKAEIVDTIRTTERASIPSSSPITPVPGTTEGAPSGR